MTSEHTDLEQSLHQLLVGAREDGVTLLVGQEEAGRQDGRLDRLPTPPVNRLTGRQVLSDLEGDGDLLVAVTHEW